MEEPEENESAASVTFPPPSSNWGTITHAIVGDDNEGVAIDFVRGEARRIGESVSNELDRSLLSSLDSEEEGAVDSFRYATAQRDDRHPIPMNWRIETDFSIERRSYMIMVELGMNPREHSLRYTSNLPEYQLYEYGSPSSERRGEHPLIRRQIIRCIEDLIRMAINSYPTPSFRGALMSRAPDPVILHPEDYARIVRDVMV